MCFGERVLTEVERCLWDISHVTLTKQISFELAHCRQRRQQ